MHNPNENHLIAYVVKRYTLTHHLDYRKINNLKTVLGNISNLYMYIVFLEGKTVVLEKFNETVELVNSPNCNKICYSKSDFYIFLLFLLILFFVAKVTFIVYKKIKNKIENRNIKLLNIHPESDGE